MMRTRPFSIFYFLFFIPLLGATTAPSTTESLYTDPTATTSAVITQMLPNSSNSPNSPTTTITTTTLTNVKRITITQEILVIEWGTTSTTLLPKQFITSIALNKRTPTTQPTTQSATQP